MRSPAELVVRPAVEHREALLALLAAASAGCFCRFWHFDGDDYAWQARCSLEPHDNRRAFERALAERSDEAQGLVALAGERVVGWIKLAPAAAMPKIRTRRLYRAMSHFSGERAGVYVVGCILVHPEMRRRGVARALVAGAVELARRSGARAVEALAVRADGAARDDELWTGPDAVFLEAGFARVDGPDRYPVLRLELGGA